MRNKSSFYTQATTLFIPWDRLPRIDNENESPLRDRAEAIDRKRHREWKSKAESTKSSQI